ncbi:hypothetical protein ACFQUU_17055 [Herbaspirillum sp. GCM10030257]|uniref:hypothetical protein n=1 Tax=Herbaspirillum sp. GCM10030257 TaxID=3273393 RepID=UPI00361EFB30
MELSKIDIKNVASALDIQHYHRTKQRKFPHIEYATLVDKFFAGKSVTLAEMSEVCATEAARWAYVESLLRIFPVHAALALEGIWNGETITNGMMLAHAITKATVFLPIDDFAYVFARVMRDVDDGGISFAEVAQSADKAKNLDDRCYEIFTGWISDAIGSRERTLDLAMHIAGERLFAIGSVLSGHKNKTSCMMDDQVCIGVVKELLLGDREFRVMPTRKRNTASIGLSA